MDRLFRAVRLRPITLITAIYTVAAVAALPWARSIALPTRGGISPSEVIQFVVPGGLETLLNIWVLLALLSAAEWLWHALGRQRNAGHGH